MNFIEAIKLLRLNKDIKIHRKGRPYILGDDKVRGFFRCYGFDRQIDEVGVTTSDVLADDWEIYREQPKLHTFEEPLAALKNGAKIYLPSTVENEDDKKRENAMCGRAEPSQLLFCNNKGFETDDWIILDNEDTK